MSEKTSHSSWGVGPLFLLFLLFLTLKLTEVIDWSWWWVTSPLWGIFALIAAIWVLAVAFGVAMAVFFGSIMSMIEARTDRRIARAYQPLRGEKRRRH